MNRWMC